MAEPKTARRLNDRYDPRSYGNCIRRLCRQLGIPEWSPNRLRHNLGTQVRVQYGVEITRAILGHALVETSQIYAEADDATAMRIMEKIG